MAAGNAGDGNALLKRHAPKFSAALSRAIKSRRVSEAQAAEVENLARHSRSPLLQGHLAAIEKGFVKSRDVRQALSALVGLCQRSTLPPVRAKLSGLRIAATALAASGAVALGGTGLATGIVMHLDPKTARPTAGQALKKVLDAERSAPAALLEAWRQRGSKRPSNRQNMAQRMDYSSKPLAFQDPPGLLLREVARPASGLFKWMEPTTPKIRSRLLSAYPNIDGILAPTVQRPDIGPSASDVSLDGQFSQLFNSDEGRLQRLKLLVDLHTYFLPSAAKPQGFPKAEDVDQRLKKLTELHTPVSLPPLAPTSQVPLVAAGAGSPSSASGQVNLATAPPAIPVVKPTTSGLSQDALIALSSHYSLLGDDYAKVANYSRAVQLKEMALRLAKEGSSPTSQKRIPLEAEIAQYKNRMQPGYKPPVARQSLLQLLQQNGLHVRLHFGQGNPVQNLDELIQEHLSMLPPKFVAKVSTGSTSEKLAKLKELFTQRAFHKRVGNEALLLFVQYESAARHLAKTDAAGKALGQQAAELADILGEKYALRYAGKEESHDEPVPTGGSVQSP